MHIINRDINNLKKIIMEITVDSFELDHRLVKAPFIRLASESFAPDNALAFVTKLDVRFCQPNKAEIKPDALHTLEHILAVELRKFVPGYIDISPMGCRTGFYFMVWNKPDLDLIRKAVLKSLLNIGSYTEVPAGNEVQCGNAAAHDLEGAQEAALNLISSGDKFGLLNKDGSVWS